MVKNKYNLAVLKGNLNEPAVSIGMLIYMFVLSLSNASASFLSLVQHFQLIFT